MLHFIPCTAQQTVLHAFQGAPDGAYPYNDLVSDGVFLYGTASSDGTTYWGIIYKIKPDGTGYTKLLDFTGANGKNPMGGLYYDGTFLYGMTSGGGVNEKGVIFKIKPDGTGYSKLLDFSGTNGESPVSNIFISDGTFLYGMTTQGGSSGQGVVFKIKTDGTGYSKLLDFTGSNGTGPKGGFFFDGTYLYGNTSSGGTSSKGVIFKIKPDGSSYSKLFDFSGINGHGPLGSLISDGTYLYGTTQYGGGLTGGSGSGTIYKIKPDGTSFTNLHNFDYMNGEFPTGTLVSAGGFLYGMTEMGTPNNSGCIFKINSDGSGFSQVINFTYGSAASASRPRAALIYQNGYFYGTCGTGGGPFGKGTIFKYYRFDVDNINATMVDCYGGNNGMATAVVTSGLAPYAYSWNTTPVQTGPTATGLTAGSYTVTVTDANNATATASVTITQPSPTPAPEICMVTVDSASTHNIIYWDKTSYTNVDSFIVYRETISNTYKRIGALSKDSISMLVDTVAALYFPFTGDPNVGTYRYKLQIRDTCGNYSALSLYHNTIYVTRTGGTFNWNHYSIEGQSTPISALSAYMLLRDNTSNGNWMTIGGVAGTQLTITDPNYASYPNARWRIETIWSISCEPTRASVNTTRSNIKNGSAVSTGINYNDNFKRLNIYPNPANAEITIEFIAERINELTIYNSLGQIIFNESISGSGTFVKKNVDISSFEKGIYLISIKNENDSIIKRVAIQ
jgi:uncharacterized repeat protein (TIGR03803 family)